MFSNTFIDQKELYNRVKEELPVVLEQFLGMNHNLKSIRPLVEDKMVMQGIEETMKKVSGFLELFENEIIPGLKESIDDKYKLTQRIEEIVRLE